MACNNTYSKRDSEVSNSSRKTGSPTVRKSENGLYEKNPDLQQKNEERVLQQAEKLVHQLFPEFHGQSLKEIREQLASDTASTAHKRMLQQIGETFATQVWAGPALGIQQIGYQSPYHGIDHIGMTSDGRMAVFETKCYGSKPSEDAGLKQLDWSHLQNRFAKMNVDGYQAAQGQNATISAIAHSAEIDRYLVHVSYKEQEAWVYKVTDGPNGELQREEVAHAHASEFMGAMYPVFFDPEKR